MTNGPLLVGRSDVDEAGKPHFVDVDVTDADRGLVVSRRHLKITIEATALLLEDLGSSNGTFIEGIGRLTPNEPTRAPLTARIMLGRGGPVLSLCV